MAAAAFEWPSGSSFLEDDDYDDSESSTGSESEVDDEDTDVEEWSEELGPKVVIASATANEVVDKEEAVLQSPASPRPGEQEAAATEETLTLAVSLLVGSQGLNLGRPIIETKRSLLERRCTGRVLVDKASLYARALLNLNIIEHLLPRSCSMVIAQYLRPTESRRDLKRYFKVGAVRNRCLDIDAFLKIYPMRLDGEKSCLRLFDLEGIHHVLWCHEAWNRIYEPWKAQVV
eukprot:TRINITY_DN74329_c0_g1_i1.p1 TRINITY_DN74329_c0_g1~~TRINITY_DN74329_c0_g1_i1.p1  ORF type:complete len:232 (+),score=45.20 TRINITY_DN74329_c0_g1_i1:113-808(+)